MPAKRDRIILHAKYKKGSNKIGNAKLPDLNHLKDGWYAYEAEITGAGRIALADGSEAEFHDIRVLLKKRGEPNAKET